MHIDAACIAILQMDTAKCSSSIRNEVAVQYLHPFRSVSPSLHDAGCLVPSTTGYHRRLRRHMLTEDGGFRITLQKKCLKVERH